MKKLHKILTFSLLIMLMLSLFSFAGVSNIALAAEGYDSTDVLTDLQSMDGFDLSDYPVNALGEIEIINFSEFGYGYTAAQSEYYALYIYVYNPAQTDIKAGSGQNKLQMAVSYNSDGEPNIYEKFDIQLLSESSDGLFYKYKVIDHYVDGTTFYNRVSASARRYDVSGIELLTKGAILSEEYAVNSTFTYTGYAAGLGDNNSNISTLNCVHNKLLTVQLDVENTFYRTGISDLGYGHQNQINSVYFSVPDEITSEYGSLYGAKAIWNEYRTSPALITDNDNMYNAIKNYMGYDVGGYDVAVSYQLVSDKYTYFAGNTINNYSYLISYNFNEEEATEIYLVLNNYYYSLDEIESIFYIFPVDNIVGDFIPGEDVETYIYAYSKSFDTGYFYLGDFKISKDLFDLTTSKGAVTAYIDNSGNYDYDLLSYDSTHSAWNKFWDNVGGSMSDINTSEEYLDIKPIEKVTAADLESDTASSDLLVNSNDLADLSEYITNAGDDNVYLFRFAASDYYSVPVHNFYAANESGYIAQQTVYLGFDVIELTFLKNEVQTVIPVCANPINVIGDITAPLDANTWPWWVWLLIALSIVAFIIIVIVLWPVWKVCLQGLWYVVCLPFRGTAALYHKIRGD